MPLRSFDTITEERVRWLWPGYIPFGKLTLVDGDPGLGKSTLMCYLAAQLSNAGELPGGKVHAPMATLLIMGEDGPGDTTKPRLQNAGATEPLIFIQDGYPDAKGEHQSPSFPSDLDRLKEDIFRCAAGLVVIDPILGCIDEGIPTGDDARMRRVLTPLANVAEETGAAIVMLRHLNKSVGQNAMQRGQASTAFVAVSRSVLLMGRDPDDRDLIVLASTKINIGARPPSRAFRLVGCENGAAKLDWQGTVERTADDLVRPERPGAEQGALAEAVEFLKQTFPAGQGIRLTAKDFWRQAREAGHSDSTIKAAKPLAAVRSEKEQVPDGKWYWFRGEEVDAATSSNSSDSGAKNGRGPVEEVEMSFRHISSTSSTSLTSSTSSDCTAKNSKSSKESKSLKNPEEGAEQLLRRPAAAWPIVAQAGRYECANFCGRTAYLKEGAMQLCGVCRQGYENLGHKSAD